MRKEKSVLALLLLSAFPCLGQFSPTCQVEST
jgi:hypothetical protein